MSRNNATHSTALVNTPHMVRVFQALPIKGYESARSWEFAEGIMDKPNYYGLIEAMISNYDGTDVGVIVKQAREFCDDMVSATGRVYSRKSATACVAIAHAIVNFA